MRAAVLLFLFLPASAEPGGPAPAATLRVAPAARQDEIDRSARESGLQDARTGVLLATADGEVLASRNETELHTLASNTKLLTCAAALDRLGADFAFETVVSLDAAGRLVVTGNGDPNISGRFFEDDPSALFKKWAAALRAKGVAKVEGIVLVSDRFDGETTCPGWKKYDPWWWWAAPFGTFSLNDNCVDVRIEPGAEGEPAKITIVPDTKYVTIVNRTKTVAKSPKSWGFTRKGRDITFTGEIQKTQTAWVSIDDPNAFYGTVLRETLESAGIRTGEVQVVGKTPEGLVEVGRHRTDLAKTIQVCLTVSQNFYAETLLRILGREVRGLGSRENGLAVVREFLKTIDITEYVQSDGSGLTRENQMAPRDLVKLLRHMRGKKAWAEALAVNGAEKGTLRKRMTEKDLAGRVRAKTGHISGVSALSGYLETKGGRTLIFSILVNDWKAGRPDDFQDRLCAEWIRGR